MESPDPILVLRAQTGDRDALDRLLRMCQQPLHRTICNWIADRTAADDVLQETLLRIARKLSWLSDPELFRAWAFRIAWRETQRHIGRRRFFEPIKHHDLPAREEEPLRPDEIASLRKAVDALSPASRSVISLHYYEEFTFEEIAAVLEIPLGTVKSRLAYGLRQLRAQWRES